MAESGRPVDDDPLGVRTTMREGARHALEHLPVRACRSPRYPPGNTAHWIQDSGWRTVISCGNLFVFGAGSFTLMPTSGRCGADGTTRKRRTITSAMTPRT